MNIVVNGAERDIPIGQTVAQLIEELSMVGERIAVEVNQEIVPRSTYDNHELRPNDKVEVVTAIGGG